ncbi:hypothetical protein ANN_24350 [Periplaneta americana]|uniref:Reverse transcriptase domain-containing protein n=1 Tax=Periplaneta americana TaxID=6978 RepID=A0ABQ8S388_PERAM|nr:hypothetical protein ANN_24350 [Periplaneta americana]
MEEQLEEEQFGFRKGKGTRDAIGLLRTIGERYLDKNEEVYVVFVDLEKALDRVDWNKLMGILMKIDVDWKERRLFSNLYMKRVEVSIGEEMSEGSEIGRGVRQLTTYESNDHEQVQRSARFANENMLQIIELFRITFQHKVWICSYVTLTIRHSTPVDCGRGTNAFPMFSTRLSSVLYPCYRGYTPIYNGLAIRCA